MKQNRNVGVFVKRHFLKKLDHKKWVVNVGMVVERWCEACVLEGLLAVFSISGVLELEKDEERENEREKKEKQKDEEGGVVLEERNCREREEG